MATLKKGVLKINFKNNGWEELFYFDATVDYPTALGHLQNIAYGRSAFYGTGVEIVFARVSSTDARHDGLACDLPYPVGPHPSWGRGASIPLPDRLSTPEDPFTCVQMRFETADASFFQRYMRGMPDHYVDDKILTYPDYYRPLPTGAALVNMNPRTGATGSHLATCQTFWRYLLTNTVHAHEIAPHDFSTKQLAYCMPIRITSKSTGRPYGVSAGRRQKTLIA